MADLLASEYGWTMEEILGLPIDQTPQLIHAMLTRKGIKCYYAKPIADPSAPSLADRLRELSNLDTVNEA
jgi:hypothetical protein